MDDDIFEISDAKLCDKVGAAMSPLKSGTYTLIGLGLDGEPKPVPRFLGVDPTGILYYGKSANVKNRVGQLRQTICAFYGEERYVGGNHSGAWKLKYFPDGLRKLFPNYRLFRVKVAAWASVVEGSDDLDWSGQEGRMLREYREQFGEVPPLNG